MPLLLFKRGALDQEIINISRESAEVLWLRLREEFKEVQKACPWDMKFFASIYNQFFSINKALHLFSR